MEIMELIRKTEREVLSDLKKVCHFSYDYAVGLMSVGGLKPGKAGDIAAMIDHTLLKPNAGYDQIEKLCTEARSYKFASVCVNPTHVALAAKLLKDSEVKVCTVIGFPLGSSTPTVKAMETRDAIANGAGEVDMVINISALKSGDLKLLFEDIRSVVSAAAGHALTKVIIETCYLTDEEKIRASLLAKYAGADFVKTSTGFGTAGATVDDVALIRKALGPALGVKAAGGIHDRATAELMIRAGATRLGTSSGVAIVKEGSPLKEG